MKGKLHIFYQTVMFFHSIMVLKAGIQQITHIFVILKFHILKVNLKFKNLEWPINLQQFTAHIKKCLTGRIYPAIYFIEHAI